MGYMDIYIAVTSRQLESRVEEHLNSWRKGSLHESAFANPIISIGRRFKVISKSLFSKQVACKHFEIVPYDNQEDITP